MSDLMPIPIRVNTWDSLAECNRSFFQFGDEYLPLHPNHAAQIGLLIPNDAARLSDFVFSSIPPGWPDHSEVRFKNEAVLTTHDSWNDEKRRSEIRQWLFDRGIPLHRSVYLLYNQNRIVQTTWKMVVRYWDAFAWSVGYAMVVVDHTFQWACCFHHEEMIIFGKNQ